MERALTRVVAGIVWRKQVAVRDANALAKGDQPLGGAMLGRDARQRVRDGDVGLALVCAPSRLELPLDLFVKKRSLVLEPGKRRQTQNGIRPSDGFAALVAPANGVISIVVCSSRISAQLVQTLRMPFPGTRRRL
jgi:hypothetical protein